ncbi:hypothetical protein REPUB_Repub04eG0076200 [Reevesia pubescens]
MKLTDAKLALESKYSQMNKLITVLETFLRSRSTSLDLTELRKAELIGHAKVGVCEREIEPYFNYSSTSDVFTYHPMSPEKNDHDNNHVPKYSGGFVEYNSGMKEDTRGWERVKHDENQGSVQDSGPSIITVGGFKNAPRCEIEQAGRDSPNTKIGKVCSVSAEQSKWKTSSAKLRRS